jgi:septal ring factor EnvC (AmiA/AmiB activator)
MTHATRSAAAAAAALVALSGCAPTTGAGADPCASANAPVSFGSLLSNSLSGSYDKCLDTMREDLAVAQLRARSLESQAAALRAEESRLSGERRAAARRLAEMNERQAATVAELSASDGARAVERQRLEALLAEERRLTDELEALNARGGGATAGEAADIERRQERLRTQMRALMG